MTWQYLGARIFVPAHPIAYLELGPAFALPFARVFGGRRRRRRRGLASTGRAVSLAAALVSAPLILPAGGGAGGARRMWDRDDVGRRWAAVRARSYWCGGSIPRGGWLRERGRAGAGGD